jgi:hypothetical protein
MKRLFVAVVGVLWATLASAQAVIIPSPVPALTANCVLQFNAGTGLMECNALSGVSQPLTDALGLVANGTKVLKFDVSAIAGSTTRTWTIPNANITVPTTIASLGANTFTGLQTANGGVATTTLSMSSGPLTVPGLLTVSGFGIHSFSATGAGGNYVLFRNATAGTGNYAGFGLTNNESASIQAWAGVLFSSTFTSSGPNIASGLSVGNTLAGGLQLYASSASGAIRFYSGGGTTPRAKLETYGTLTMTPGSGYASIDATSDNYAQAAFVVRNTAPNGARQLVSFARDGGTVVGTITHDGSATTSYNTTSDQRLKNDLGLATSVDVLRDSRVHDGTWKADGTLDRFLFAQEAYLVKPRAVVVGTDERDGLNMLVHPWMMDYSKYVPDLIVGWQQHDAAITALTARISALEQK